MLAFVSGLTSLGYQNLWTRILSSGTGGSSYIFTAILALFLTGITVGAFVYARFLSRTKHPVALLGVAELALAIVVLGGLGFETKFFANMSFNRDLLIVVLPATLGDGRRLPDDFDAGYGLRRSGWNQRRHATGREHSRRDHRQPSSSRSS